MSPMAVPTTWPRTPVSSCRKAPSGSRSPWMTPGSACTPACSADRRWDACDQRVCERPGDLDTDGSEHDSPDPALGFHDAVRIDCDDLVHEGDEEGQRADT